MRYRNSKEGLDNMVNKEFEKIAVVPDIHAPYHDPLTLLTVKKFIKEQQPDTIVFIGDVVDMYSVSKYDKNPERANRLQEELDTAHNVLREFRDVAPKARMIYLEGNHEARMQKYLWRHPEIHGLRNLQLPNLLRLKELGIEYRKEYLVKNTFLFTHGTRCGKYAARQELDDSGVSGMSGHIHRVQMFSKKDRSGEKAWYSIGHIADESKSEYIDHPDWQQALGMVYFMKDSKRFYAEVIPITEHKLLYGGKVYRPTK